MAVFVLDCSVSIAWVMKDEENTISNTILQKLSTESAIVPSIWKLEIGNVLLSCQRNNRISKEHRLRALYIYDELPIATDTFTGKYAWQETIELADRYSLSLYDACYLELAMRLKLPLATFDKQLKKACDTARVKIIT